MLAAAAAAAAAAADDARFAGHSRFELELEFVQALSNPLYVNHLGALRLLEDPAFVAYLAYLQYFRRPEYSRYLLYPGTTLRMLDLLQQDSFRREMLNPQERDNLTGLLMDAGIRAAYGEPVV